MKCVVVAVVVLGGAVARADTLRGTVVDKTTKQPVAGAIITAGSELAASGDDGAFEITLPTGVYRVDITADFIEPAHARVVLHGTAAITVEVTQKTAPSGETIEVHDLAPAASGETTVSAEFARAVPGGGDAAKIVQSLPAVARPSAGSTDIVVWGAAPNETRTFVEGVPVLSLYHVGGYRSAVGNDVIGDIHLTPAAFGVDRGGAIGGVIDIDLTDPAKLPAWKVQADVLDGSVEAKQTLGPATIAAAARYSWLDQAIGVIENPQQLAPNVPLPKWSDAQLVARVPLPDDFVLKAWVLGSTDSLDQVLASDDPATQTSDLDTQHSIRGSVSLRRDRPDGYDLGMLWFGHDYTSEVLDVGTITASDSERAWVGGGRGVQSMRLGGGTTLTIGTDVDASEAALARFGSLTVPAREGDKHIFGQPPGSDVSSDAWHSSTVDAAGYTSIDFGVGRVTASAGVRLDAWLLTASRLTPRLGETPAIGSQQFLDDADPRGSVRVRVTDSLDVRADAGLYHQARDPADTSAVFGNPTLGIEQAWHATTGAQYRLSPFAIEVAGYARWLDDLVARDLAVTPPLAGALTQDGIGHVYGIQLTTRLVGWHNLSGWLSYNLSDSRRKDAADQAWRYFDYDQTNGLIFVAGWEHGPWTVGTRVRYATGDPRTPVVGAFFDSTTGRYQPILGAQNSIRLPAFFAADLRGERRFPLGGIHAAVYIEVQNLTDRANAEEIIYNADYSQHGYLTGLPILAIAGLRLSP
jgi:TonB dependent receptor